MRNAGLSIAVILNSINTNEISYKNLSKEDQIIAREVNKKLEENEFTDSDRVCPECNKFFKEIVFNNVKLDFCPFCRSIWFDNSELSKFVGISKDIFSENLKSRSSKFNCPICEKKMEEHVFSRKSNLLVDVCGSHGIYLQSGELERIVKLSEEYAL